MATPIDGSTSSLGAVRLPDVSPPSPRRRPVFDRHAESSSSDCRAGVGTIVRSLTIRMRFDESITPAAVRPADDDAAALRVSCFLQKDCRP
ncbi:hypothetical protein ACVBGC_08490 [Burkholderia stagnalis]